MIEALPNDVQEMLLDSADDFLRTAHSLKRVRALRHSTAPFDRAIWKQMAELGWVGLRVPASGGGAGLDVGYAAELSARFGAALLPEPFATCAVAPAVVLASSFESSEGGYLAQALCDGSELIALAWQDEFGQLDPQWRGVAAREVDGVYELVGQKVLVEGAATTLLVSCQCDGMPLIAAVPARAAKVTRKEQRMTNGDTTATVQFAGTRVNQGAVLARGEAARIALSRALDEARLVLAAYLAGLAAGALAQSAGYVAQRVQFGHPIGDFQVIRHRFVDLDLQKRLAHAAWRHAARVCTSLGPLTETAIAAVSAAKARCSDAAMAAARAAIQFHGAFGYTEEAEIGLYLDAAMRHGSALGNAEAHRRRFMDLTPMVEIGI